MRGTPTSLRGCPARWRHRKRQQFSDRPAMVGDPSRHGRCPVGCYCASRMGSKAETRVIGAKVRHPPPSGWLDEPGRLKGGGVPSPYSNSLKPTIIVTGILVTAIRFDLFQLK